MEVEQKKEVEVKMKYVYNELLNPYLSEIENAMQKIAPAYMTRTKEECLELARKILLARALTKVSA